ncbi:MAG: hypothetical protein E7222_05015 [Clostridiales bacterium]|nr:hypothetical protein [Clostridiales bacterium]
MKKLDKLLISLMSKIPDLITGKSKEYEKELYWIYGKSEKDEVLSFKLNNLKKYAVIVFSFFIILIILVFNHLLYNQSFLLEDKDGYKYIERPTHDQGAFNVKLIVSGNIQGEEIKKPVILNIKPEGADKVREKSTNNPKDLTQEAMSRLGTVINHINKSDNAKMVYLPADIEGMKNVEWRMNKDGPVTLIIFAAGILLIGAYAKRYDEIKRLKKQCNESIEEELPDFLNKMVLLMNAGLVLPAAFEKIVRDYDEHVYKGKSYFYKQLIKINQKVSVTNASMEQELKKFAERSKNRELMRVGSVIADNIQKGTELVNILQKESDFLWFQRKKRAEEKGRIAETKLTIPLALQLLVLIIITLAPAMIEM